MTFTGLLRFAYRDHPTVGGWLARYLGLDQGWSLLAEVFRELEWRGARLVAG